jgi:predicted RNA-binding Zn ribbon-like protein
MVTQADLAFRREDDVIPPPLRLVRDFVNTVEYQEDDERWTTPADLDEWLLTRGLLQKAQPLRSTDEDLALAVTVREGLRSVLATHAGHDADASALAGLDEALRELPVQISFINSGAFGLAPAAGDPVRLALTGVLEAISASIKDGSWDRLKVCDRDTCRWAYYDYSKNHSARWCTMAGCGNAIKMQNAQARRNASA